MPAIVTSITTVPCTILPFSASLYQLAFVLSVQRVVYRLCRDLLATPLWLHLFFHQPFLSIMRETVLTIPLFIELFRLKILLHGCFLSFDELFMVLNKDMSNLIVVYEKWDNSISDFVKLDKSRCLEWLKSE